MKTVGKYNVFKGVSTLLSVGTPIITLLCTSQEIVTSPKASISFSAVFTILIVMLLLKDKLAEKWKVPSAFVLSTVLFVIIIVAENILEPLKCVCIATMCTSGIDELTFKRFYKALEEQLPAASKYSKFAGFIFTTTEKLQASEVNDAK